MILYRGELMEDSRQEELLAALETDLYAPLRRGERLEAETVIRAFDSLARRVLAGEFDDVVRPLLEAFGIGDVQFREMARNFCREGLERKCALELCDPPLLLEGNVLRERRPLGVLLHIAAGNVDALPAYSVAEGLLAENVNILKLPMGDSGLSVRLLRELVLTEPRLGEYLYVFDVPSLETETLRRLAKLADGVVVWGGDAAAAAARQLAEVDTKLILWGHKLSFAYAEPDAEDAALSALARSVCQTEQLLCSSCQGIFVDTADPDVQRTFAERFFPLFRAASREAGPPDFGMRAKNAVSLYTERLEGRTGLYSGDGVTLRLLEGEDLELSWLYRDLWIRRLPLERLYDLRRYKGHLQTAAVLAPDPEKRREIRRILGDAGVCRITGPGNMSRSVCGEAHDGLYPLREYTRITETELTAGEAEAWKRKHGGFPNG